MKLQYLTVYRGILEDPVVQRMAELPAADSRQAEETASILSSLLVQRAEKYLLEGPVLEAWIWHLVLGDVNMFSMQCENGHPAKPDSSIYQAAKRDIRILRQALSDTVSCLREYGLADYAEGYVRGHYEEKKPSPATHRAQVLAELCREWSLTGAKTDEALLERIESYYKDRGCGILAMYPMFRWVPEKGLAGVENYDPIRMDDLVGYQYQKDMLIANTQGFLAGQEANNVLLAGAGGTGKSSAVKALANEFFDDGLRLIEIGKDQMTQLSDILTFVARRGKRFILFIDDLSFEDSETEYKYMKSLLEGSVEKKPENVVFYATSNRRHIIQQKWKDRDTAHYDQEVHGMEAMNEKLSLSQRFGLTLTYPTPSQTQYLEIVHHMARQQGLTDLPEDFDRSAIRWSMEQKGFSGRTARQFILHWMQKR